VHLVTQYLLFAVYYWHYWYLGIIVIIGIIANKRRCVSNGVIVTASTEAVAIIDILGIDITN